MTYKIITIAQQKGGAGKTTVAAHLAVAFSKMGKNVAAIDIDPQGSLGHWHKVREEKFGEGNTGINFAEISGWRLHNEISRLKEGTDIIIIDGPPHTQTETKTVIRAADLVIIPAQPSPTDLWATSSTVEIVEKERIPYRILLNRVVRNSKVSQKIAEEYSNLMQTQLGNRVAFANSMINGFTAIEVYPSSPAAQEVTALVREVSRMLFPEEGYGDGNIAAGAV